MRLSDNPRASPADAVPHPLPSPSLMSDARSKLSSRGDEKTRGALVTSRDVDVCAELVAGKDVHLDSEEASRLR